MTSRFTDSERGLAKRFPEFPNGRQIQPDLQPGDTLETVEIYSQKSRVPQPVTSRGNMRLPVGVRTETIRDKEGRIVNQYSEPIIDAGSSSIKGQVALKSQSSPNLEKIRGVGKRLQENSHVSEQGKNVDRTYSADDTSRKATTLRPSGSSRKKDDFSRRQLIFGSPDYWSAVGRKSPTLVRSPEKKEKEIDEIVYLNKEDILLYLEGKKTVPEDLNLYDPRIGYLLFNADRNLWKKWRKKYQWEKQEKVLLGLLGKQILEGAISAATAGFGKSILVYVESLGLSTAIAKSINIAIEIVIKDVIYETVKQKLMFDKEPSLEELNKLIVQRILTSGVLKKIVDEEVLAKVAEFALKTAYKSIWDELSK